MDAFKPSIGWIVHYVSHGSPVLPDGTQVFASECRAAIVTEVDVSRRSLVGLRVFTPTGDFVHPLAAGGCMADLTEYQGGTWHSPRNCRTC